MVTELTGVMGNVACLVSQWIDGRGFSSDISPIHSSKPILATLPVHPNGGFKPRTASPSHQKRIALSCQTAKASFNAPYRNHRGPTNLAHPGSSHRRGASDTDRKSTRLNSSH